MNKYQAGIFQSNHFSLASFASTFGSNLNKVFNYAGFIITGRSFSSLSLLSSRSECPP